MRRPLIGLAAATLAGTLIGLAFRPSPPFLLATATVLWGGLTAGAFLRRSRARETVLSWALLALALGLSTLAASLTASPVSPADIRRWIPPDTASRIQVTGIVAGDPAPVQNRGPFALRFPMRVESIQVSTSAPTRMARGTVMVTWVNPRPVPPPAYGERWSVRAPVQDREPVSFRPGPYGAHYNARRQGNPLRQFCESRRRQALRILNAGIADHPAQAGLLQALMLGSRVALSAEVKQDFMSTGTFHVVAISGLHVGMMAWLLAVVLRVLGISRVWWFPLLAPMLIVYTLGTGASASALRACIMACLFFASNLVGRKADPPSALAASAILIVGLDPFQAVDRGFILSFCLVGGLLLMAPLLPRLKPAFLKPDPFLTPALVPRWKQLTYEAAGATWSTLVLSGAAWLTSLPLTSYFFGNVSTVALLGNLVAIPMSFLVVLAGSLSVVFGSVWLFLGEVFNYANLALITVLLKCLGLLSQIPYAYVTIPRPPLWFVFAWYAGLVLLTLHLTRNPNRNLTLNPDPSPTPPGES